MANASDITDEQQTQCSYCYDEAKHYCRTCKENLCVKCHEVHKKSTKANTNHHHVVPFLQRKESLRSPAPDTCAVHHGSKYEFGCLKCQVVICKKCVSTLHNGHKKSNDLSDFFDKMIGILKQEFSLLQHSVLPQYQETLSKLDEDPPQYGSVVESIKGKIEQETQRATDLLQYLLIEGQQAVDDIATLDQEILRVQKQNSQDHHLRLLQIEQRYREFFASIDRNVLIDFLHDRRDFKEMIKYPDKHGISPPHYNPSNISLAVLRDSFISVHSANNQPLVDIRLRHFDKKLMSEPLRISSFQIGKNTLLYQVKCVGRLDSAWVLTGESSLNHYNRAGKKLESLETSDGQNGSPGGIAVSPQNEVLFTKTAPNCIALAKVGKKPQILIPTDDWVPNGLCLTVSGGILVTLQNAANGKVVKFQEGLPTLTVQYDEIGHAIYEMPWYIAENKVNNDICVSDTKKNLLIVVNKFGKVRFQYDAPYRYFQPRDICADSQGNLLVADPYNNNVNIIGEDGDFLLNINTRYLDLTLPLALSVDVDKNLWIGGRDSRRVVVLRYIHDT